MSKFFYFRPIDLVHNGDQVVATIDSEEESLSALEPDDFLNEDNNICFSIGTEVIPDLLPNILNWPVVSGKLKSVLSSFFNKDEVCWVNVRVVSCFGKEYDYYIMNFSNQTPGWDVLDTDHSILSGKKPNQGIVKAVLNEKNASNHAVFPLPSKIRRHDGRIVVRKDVKIEIENSLCTGIDFSKVPCK